MLTLPDRLSVTLVAGTPGVQLRDLLLSIDVLVGGRYYWGSLVGLSDTEGRAEITNEVLARQFAEDRAMFLMDYKVDLNECDAGVRIRLPGGLSFTQARDEALRAAMLSPMAREAWSRARNETVAPAEMVAVFDGALQGNVALTLGPVRAVA